MTPAQSLRAALAWLHKHRAALPMIECKPDVWHMGTLRGGKSWCAHCGKAGPE